MKVILPILIIFLISGFGLYQFTKSQLVDCFVSSQEAMKSQIASGAMTDLRTSCSIGQTVLGAGMSCMTAVTQSGITQVFSPVVQRFNPKLNPEYLRQMQNGACIQYPETNL